jgi:hypothetical protein
VSESPLFLLTYRAGGGSEETLVVKPVCFPAGVPTPYDVAPSGLLWFVTVDDLSVLIPRENLISVKQLPPDTNPAVVP